MSLITIPRRIVDESSADLTETYVPGSEMGSVFADEDNDTEVYHP